MTKALTQELDNLKAALTALKPSGHDGFEGLLAAMFGSISNHPFRLAGSGSQHGKDGSGTLATGTIAFEAKLYKEKINKNEVLSKLTEIVASHPKPDLWVLGATIEIRTQISDLLERAAKKTGINVLLLDWPPTSPIPDLAVLCAVAKGKTIAFLEKAVGDQKKVKLAADALAEIRAHPSFEASSQRILTFLRNPVLGPAIAQDANSQWLRTAFSDQRIARLQFGQPLSPLADHALPAVAREDLLGKLGSAAFGPPKDEMIVLLGGEGCGKSWIFAQTWAAQYFPPLTLVIPASEIPQGLTITNEFDFLIQQIVRHTDGTADEHAIQRWRNVIEHWSSQAMHAEPNLVVFVDGLNQCPDNRWATWLDAMAYKLAKVCGRLVVSVRKGYFDTRLRDALTTPLRIISVEEWTETELRAILSERGVAAQNLSAKVIKTLCNLRVLGIAFDLLKDGSIKDFDELSVERLLFQHIRKSSLDQNSTEMPLVFTKRLSAHANDVLERVKAERANDTMIFESADLASGSPHALTQDLLAVSEGKFFRALPDDPYLYELTDDGLILALGFAVLDAMKSGLRNYTSANEALDTMLEPISALDRPPTQ